MEVLVRSALAAYIIPSFLVARNGQDVLLNCSVFGYPINSVTWLKDGQRMDYIHEPSYAINGKLLRITNFQQTNQGTYQCVVTNNFETVQAAANILHGGQLHASFLCHHKDFYWSWHGHILFTSDGHSVPSQCLEPYWGSRSTRRLDYGT